MTSPFFKVPLELRIEIYRYLLRSPRVIYVRNSPHVRNDPPYEFVSVRVIQFKDAEEEMHSKGQLHRDIKFKEATLGNSPKKEIESAILLVNKQTSLEARCIIYAENSFVFQVPEDPAIPLRMFSTTPSLAEKHQNQYQASKDDVIFLQGPKINQVEIISTCGSPSCSEPISFFETQPRDFRFMRTMIFRYKMGSRIHPSLEEAEREHIFRDTCHYISQHLQLFHLTLIVTSDYFAYQSAIGHEDPFGEQFVATVPQMKWVQYLVPVVTNLRTLHISTPGRGPFEEPLMGYLQSKMLKTQMSVRQS